jgi:cyclic beta-1,2-glucan synthetase
LKAKDATFLRESAERIWRFYKDWSSPANHWLIPDNVCEDGRVAQRLSPTNLGLLLNSRIAAVHLNLIGLSEFVHETKNTLESMDRLRKYRGHLLNWYDSESLAPLEPLFVSSVDSGNLAACLWTLKQASIEFIERGVTDDMRTELLAIATTCHRMVQEMDFRFLYQRRKKVLSVGYDVAAGKLEPASYDLLASESRIASFVAIAKGDVPQEAWFHLGRTHTLYGGRRVLLSWTGTMFEYLMPSLWMNQYTGTITESSVNAAVDAQQKFARGFGIPWGISESGCCSLTAAGDYDYAPFGLKALALKHSDAHHLVISPYSSFLALHVDPNGAIRNLRRMEELGWSGRYGFYESCDYGSGNPGLVRSWMAHHQGMSLLATCNILCGDAFRRHFHAEPQVMATDLLLHERVPTTVVPERQIDTPHETGATVSAAA